MKKKIRKSRSQVSSHIFLRVLVSARCQRSIVSRLNSFRLLVRVARTKSLVISNETRFNPLMCLLPVSIGYTVGVVSTDTGSLQTYFQDACSWWSVYVDVTIVIEKSLQSLTHATPQSESDDVIDMRGYQLSTSPNGGWTMASVVSCRPHQIPCIIWFSSEIDYSSRLNRSLLCILLVVGLPNIFRRDVHVITQLPQPKTWQWSQESSYCYIVWLCHHYGQQSFQAMRWLTHFPTLLHYLSLEFHRRWELIVFP